MFVPLENQFGNEFSMVSSYSDPEAISSLNNLRKAIKAIGGMSSFPRLHGGKKSYLCHAAGIELFFQSLQHHCFKKLLCRQSAFRFFL